MEQGSPQTDMVYSKKMIPEMNTSNEIVAS
jgi:hypothetical protein